MSERTKLIVSEMMKTAAKRDHAASANFLLSSRTPDMTWQERATLESFTVGQYSFLKEWNEAEKLCLELLRYPEFDFTDGIFGIGQKFAATVLVEKMVESGEFQRAELFATKAVELRKEWRASRDHSLASFWTAVGEAQYKNANIDQAVVSWEMARAAWSSKKELWKALEPEKFELYRGLDRFNPLELKVSAYLLGAYSKLVRRNQIEEILSQWRLQSDVLEVAHRDSPISVVKAFERSRRNALKDASVFVDVPDLPNLLPASAVVLRCSAFFESK